jgi:hypothetical protein
VLLILQVFISIFIYLFFLGNPTNINQVSTGITLLITSDVQTNVQFTGTAYKLTTSSPTCLSFDDIVLTRPLAGNYYFAFIPSSILQPLQLVVQVNEGDPVSLSFYRQPGISCLKKNM